MKKILTILTVLGACVWAHGQDTIVVHDVTLTAANGVYKADDKVISGEVYKRWTEEQAQFKAKVLNKVFWVKKLDKNNLLTEQGLFCSGNQPIGNHIKYNAKGQICYKKLYTVQNPPQCNMANVGTKATEEIFDLDNGYRIYGSYENGHKQGQFFLYDRANNIIGVEGYDKGRLVIRKGKTFSVRPDGSVEIAPATK